MAKRNMAYICRSLCRSSFTEKKYKKAEVDNLIATIDKLDMAIRKVSRISIKDVEIVFKHFINSGKTEPKDSLLVIRCCGELLPEEKLETRTTLVTEIWNSFEESGGFFDVYHYNELLKVHFENEHKFNPMDFLSKMEFKHIMPNKTTYELLIANYCQQGDTEGAKQILHYMKDKGLPINERTFNNLILGHSKADKLLDAKNILNAMRKSGLEPGIRSYSPILNLFAVKGDMQSMRQMFEIMEKKNVFLLDKHYLDIIYHLAKNCHTQHIMKMMNKFVAFNQDCMTCIVKLVNCDQDEIALQLLNEMTPTTLSNGYVLPCGGFLIRQLVRVERPVDKIIRICADLKSRGVNKIALETATQNALIHEKTGHAFAFIMAMKNEGLPVRTHYFWPILLQLKKQKEDESKLYEVIKLMKDYDCPAEYRTLIDYFYPNIDTNVYKNVISRLENLGYNIESVAIPLVEHYIMQNELEKAVALMNEHVKRINMISMTKALAQACETTGDVNSTLNILQMLKSKNHTDSSLDVYGKFLINYCRQERRNEHKTERILRGMLDKKLSITHKVKAEIQNYMKVAANHPINELLCKLVISQVIPQVIEKNTIRTTVEELEIQLIDRMNKNKNTKGILVKLLIYFCRDNNLERAEELKAELDSLGVNYMDGIMMLLMELYSNHDRIVEAKQILKKLKTDRPNLAIDERKLLNFAAALVRVGEDEEGLQFLEEQEVEIVSVKKEMAAWRLVDAAADKGNVVLTQRLFDVIMKRKLCKPSNKILGPIIKSYCIKGDLKGAVVKFEEICKMYRCTPWRSHLLERLIEDEDTEGIHKIIELNSKIHGKENTMYDLAFSFLYCGKLRDAHKIFHNTGFRAKQDRLDLQCKRLIEENRICVLEDLVRTTRDLLDINRDRMFYYLLTAYGKVNDFDKALEVWMMMQEECVAPSDRTLRCLANILQENNKPVPFAVPEFNS
uniref:Pentacotripeptide-repeat region of PRORP domain-containing protein n=1 Tax=Strigamia maritima TaxID=126957 RepID=T1IT81_STRMM